MADDMIMEGVKSFKEIGLGGFAIYALFNVWKRLIEQSNIHREEMRVQLERHNKAMAELVARNMDEHRERNRVMVKLAMSVAEAFTRHSLKFPDPYPNIDTQGRKKAPSAENEIFGD